MFKKTLIVFLITLVASIFGAIATYDHSVYAQIPGLTDSQQEPQSQEQQGEQEQTFLTFENPTYKFKIQYPSDWQVKPVGRSPPSGAIGAGAFVSSDNATLTVTVQNLSQYLDVNDLQVKKRTAQDYAKEAFATLSVRSASGIKPIRISQNNRCWLW